MTEETIGGLMASNASHCAAKSGGVASPAVGATGGPETFKKCPHLILVRTIAMRRWIRDPKIDLICPLPLVRTSSAHATMSLGCISSAPQAPRLPAFMTAIDKDGAEAPAIGASRIGSCKPKRRQKASARDWSRDILPLLHSAT